MACPQKVFCDQPYQPPNRLIPRGDRNHELSSYERIRKIFRASAVLDGERQLIASLRDQHLHKSWLYLSSHDHRGPFKLLQIRSPNVNLLVARLEIKDDFRRRHAAHIVLNRVRPPVALSNQGIAQTSGITKTQIRLTLDFLTPEPFSPPHAVRRLHPKFRWPARRRPERAHGPPRPGYSQDTPQQIFSVHQLLPTASRHRAGTRKDGLRSI